MTDAANPTNACIRDGSVLNMVYDLKTARLMSAQ